MVQPWAYSQGMIDAKCCSCRQHRPRFMGASRQASRPMCLLPEAERVGWWLLATSTRSLAGPVGTCGRLAVSAAAASTHGPCLGCPLVPAAAWRGTGLAPARAECGSCRMPGLPWLLWWRSCGMIASLGCWQRIRGDLRKGHGTLMWMGCSGLRAPR